MLLLRVFPFVRNFRRQVSLSNKQVCVHVAKINSTQWKCMNHESKR